MYNLSCNNLSKDFNKTTILSNVSISVSKGECLGILGDNGSGKSTLMSIFAGVLAPTSGQILLNDSLEFDRKKIAYVPQEPALFENLSVLDNYKIWLSAYNISDLNIPEFLYTDPKKKVSKLSGGQKKKISIAIALLNNPDFIIMDEAFASLDAKTVDLLTNYLKNNKNLGVLYSSHNILEIANICDRCIVLKNGQVHYEHTSKINLDNVQSLYEKF
ncbi:MAG: ATP-binding cassette domain-containing protein [Clostridia bacterium]